MRNYIIPWMLFLASCSSVPTPAPYKIDVQQGNMVSQEMVSRLKAGMSKSQVRFIMGTPLVTDAFHANRWDYVYRYQKAGQLTEARRITLIFEQDALARIERSEEHTSELQSPKDIVCRLL